MYLAYPHTINLHEVLKDYPRMQDALKFLLNILDAKCYKTTSYDKMYQKCNAERKRQLPYKETIYYHNLVCANLTPKACLNCDRESYVIQPATKCEECFFFYVESLVFTWRQRGTIKNWDGVVPSFAH